MSLYKILYDSPTGVWLIKKRAKDKRSAKSSFLKKFSKVKIKIIDVYKD